MMHSYIHDNDIRERYVTGRLSLEERLRFEVHLSDCDECLGEVEALEQFRSGLQAVVTEDVLHGVVPQGEIWAWLAARGRTKRVILLAVLLLILSLSATFAYILAGRNARARLTQLQSAHSALQREHLEQQDSINKLKAQLQDAQAEAQHHPLNQVKVNGALGVAASLPVFTLNHVRDLDRDSPANEISLSHSSAWVVLLMDLDPDPNAQLYQASLFGDNNMMIWKTDLKPKGKNGIAISLKTDLFQPGNYVLELKGCSKRGKCGSEATYSFRVNRID